MVVVLLDTFPSGDLTNKDTLLPGLTVDGMAKLICDTPGYPGVCPQYVGCAATPPTNNAGIALALHSPFAAGHVPFPSGTEGVIAPRPVT